MIPKKCVCRKSKILTFDRILMNFFFKKDTSLDNTIFFRTFFDRQTHLTII